MHEKSQHNLLNKQPGYKKKVYFIPSSLFKSIKVWTLAYWLYFYAHSSSYSVYRVYVVVFLVIMRRKLGTWVRIFFFCVIFTSRHYNFFFLSSLPERRQQRSNQEQPCVIEMEQPKKKTSVTSVKSPAKSKLSLNEEPPPTYEEWLHLSGQVTPDF